MKNEKYLKYKKIKSSLAKYGYKDISTDKLAGFNVAYIVYSFASMSLTEKIKLLINFLFFIPRVKFSAGESRAVYGWSIDRKDYKFLSDGYKKSMDKCFTDLCLSFQGASKKIRIDCKSLWVAGKIAYHADLSEAKDKAIVFFSVYKSISFLNYLEKNFDASGLEIYLSFNSSFDYESVLTLFLKGKNVLTYSMQHGMYFKYENSIPFDVINYENVTADYLLAWGEFSKQQIADYLPKETKVIVFGHPHHKDDSFDFQRKDSNKILVGLPRQLYIQENKKLLSLIKSKDLKNYCFSVRPHPSNDKDSIRKMIQDHENIIISDEKNLIDELRDGGFACFVGYNSTLLFEVAHYGLPVLQFLSGNDEFLKAGFYEFKTPDEFMKIVSDKTALSDKPKEISYFS